jgi:hypothetical protein
MAVHLHMGAQTAYPVVLADGVELLFCMGQVQLASRGKRKPPGAKPGCFPWLC